MTRVTTLGSVWLIDDTRKLYWRFPLTEQPRPNNWGGPDSGAQVPTTQEQAEDAKRVWLAIALQDAVPHEFVAWRIEMIPEHLETWATVIDGLVCIEERGDAIAALRIDTPDGKTLHAPHAHIDTKEPS